MEESIVGGSFDIGRFRYDDGVNVFEGPALAIKREMIATLNTNGRGKE